MSEKLQAPELSEQAMQAAHEDGPIALGNQRPPKEGEGMSWQDTANMVNSTLDKGDKPYSAEDIQAIDQRIAQRENRQPEQRVLSREPLSDDEKTAAKINSTLVRGDTPRTVSEVAAIRERKAA